jgi:uncharacterized integral membrane protein
MTLESTGIRDFDTGKNQPTTLHQWMEIKALSDPETHAVKPGQATLTKAEGQSKLSAYMPNIPKFWKSPRFWVVLILLLWLVYVLNGNLETAVTLWLIPLWVHPMVHLSWVILGSAIFGALLTLLIQFAMRRRSSKYASASEAASVSSSNTAA